MSNAAISVIVGVLGLAVLAPVAAEKFHRAGDEGALQMPANDDFATSSGSMRMSGGGSSPPPCPADLNHDGVVNGADLADLLGVWGPCSSSSCPADLNHDLVVDGADLAVLLGAWGP